MASSAVSTDSCTVVLYDGSPAHPSLDALWQVALDTGASVLGMGSGSHSFHLPSPGSTGTPYEHGFSIKVNGTPLGEDGTSAQLLGFVKSRLCTYQRNLTAAQVAGTGTVPAGGRGSLSFNIHLSTEAPPVNEHNSDQFVVTATRQAPGGNADLAHPITGTVTFPSGAQDATLTVPIAAEPAGTPPVSITFLLTGNAKHVPSPVLVTGTVTTT